MPRSGECSVIAVGLFEQDGDVRTSPNRPQKQERQQAYGENAKGPHKVTLDTGLDSCNLEPVAQPRSCNLALSTRKQMTKY